MNTLKSILSSFRKPVPAKSLTSIVIENAKMWDKISTRNGYGVAPHFVVTASGQAFCPL